MLTVVFALGCMPIAEWAAIRVRRLLVGIGLGVSAVVTSVIALPVLPLGVVGSTPVPHRDPSAVIVVGGQLPDLQPLFATCRTAARIDDGVGVDNEEQGEPVAVCAGPRMPLPALLVAARHLG